MEDQARKTLAIAGMKAGTKCAATMTLRAAARGYRRNCGSTSEPANARRNGGRFIRAEARKERAKARALVKPGINLPHHRQLDRIKCGQENATIFEAVAREWLALKDWEAVTKARRLDMLERAVFAKIRDDDTINYGVVQPGDDLDEDEGVLLVRVGDLIEGRVRHSELKRTAPSIEAAYKRLRCRIGVEQPRSRERL